MQSFIRLFAICAVFVLSMRADRLSPTVQPTPVKKDAKAVCSKPKRLKWLRRLGAAEVGLAMKLSAIGIPQPAPPESAAVAW
jgi:hypothetical protein